MGLSKIKFRPSFQKRYPGKKKVSKGWCGYKKKKNSVLASSDFGYIYHIWGQGTQSQNYCKSWHQSIAIVSGRLKPRMQQWCQRQWGKNKSICDFVWSRNKEDRGLSNRDYHAMLIDHRESRTARLLFCFFLFFKENGHLVGKRNMNVEEAEAQVGEIMLSKTPFLSKMSSSLPKNPV